VSLFGHTRHENAPGLQPPAYCPPEQLSVRDPAGSENDQRRRGREDVLANAWIDRLTGPVAPILSRFNRDFNLAKTLVYAGSGRWFHDPADGT
jgi:hypothetical protein